MMEATLSWPWKAGLNRPVGRGLWTWLDLVDPDPGPVLLAGTTGHGYWPFSHDQVTRINHPRSLRRALESEPTLIVLDEWFLDHHPAVVQALTEAASRGATIMIGPTADERAGRGPRLGGRVGDLSDRATRRVRTGPGSFASRPAGPGLSRLVTSLPTPVATACLTPAVGNGAVPHQPDPEPHTDSCPSVLMLPDTSGLEGPSLHRWRAMPSGDVRAPLVILARTWSALPTTASKFVGRKPDVSNPLAKNDQHVGWEFGPPRGYATQKSILFITGSETMVIKQSRDELGSKRLAAEIEALRSVWPLMDASAVTWPESPVTVPQVLEEHRESGRTLVAESSLAGPSLLDLIANGTGAREAGPLVDFLIRLAMSTSEATTAAGRAAAFGTVAGRFAETFPLHRGARARVVAAANRIADVGIPSVHFHGDYTPWNVVRTDATWAVHDWENADPSGPPLWDLSMLLIGIVNAVMGPLAPRELAEILTTHGPLHELMTEWTDRYCRDVGVDPRLVADLWITGLAHQAVKESTRSSRGRGVTGRSLLLLLNLRRLGGLPGDRTR